MSNLKLPDFLIVGGQKCGSTTLHNILDKHPEIFMSKKKEINFFTIKKKYDKGINSYAKHFEAAEKNKRIGESSPGYMVHPEVPKRIRKDLGQIKIVMVLRNPIKRAMSQYWDNRRQLKESLSFEQSVDKYLHEQYRPGERGYFSRGVYIQYIEKYEVLFGAENLHILLLEDLIKTTQPVLEALYRFLEVNPEDGLQQLPPAYNPATIWSNPSYNLFFNYPALTTLLPRRGRSLLFFGKNVPYKYPQPANEIINKLNDFYAPYNNKLAAKLGRKLDGW